MVKRTACLYQSEGGGQLRRMRSAADALGSFQPTRKNHGREKISFDQLDFRNCLFSIFFSTWMCGREMPTYRKVGMNIKRDVTQ